MADFARIGSDVLRLGSGIGCALFNDRASASDKAWAVARDIGRGLTIPGAGIAAKATFRVAKGVGKALSKARPSRKLVKFADPKFAKQLERQLAKDGPKSVKKSLRTLEKRLAQHKKKLPSLKYKSSVERETRTFKRQVDTAKQFLKRKGIK